MKGLSLNQRFIVPRHGVDSKFLRSFVFGVKDDEFLDLMKSFCCFSKDFRVSNGLIINQAKRTKL